MKKTIIVLAGLFLTITMQAQDRPQPKQGPAPEVNVKKPETFTLPNGLKVMVVEDHKLPRVSFSLSLDNAPYAEGNKKGVADLASAMIGNGSKKTPKDAFNEEVDFLGANISFSSNGAYASSLSKHAGRVLELMAEGALMPNFTQVELDKERAQLLEGLRSEEKSVTAVAGRVVNVLAYGKNHPSGEYLSESTINAVTLADIQENYNTYFVPGNAYLVVIGDIKTKDIKKTVTKLFGGWAKSTAPRLTYTDPQNVQFTQINFVDMPNAVQSEISLVNTVTLEMKDPDFFPVILANQVLGGDFNSYLNMNLREAHGWTYGARSSIGGSRYVGTFTSSSQVRNAVTDSAVVEFVKEIKRIRTEPVSEEVLNNVKAGYIGRFVMQVAKPQTIARYALNIETEGLPEDFYRNYIKNINAVTPADIQRVANKYFLAGNTRIIIVGKGSEVLPSLEKIKDTPIFYFDKYGAPIDKPVMNKPLPAGVTAKSVFTSYINAIGGEKAVSAVKTINVKAAGSVQGMTLGYEKKATSAGKSMESLSVMGQSMKKVYDGKAGYQSQGAQKKPMDADEAEAMKFYAQPFPELTLGSKPGVVLSGIESFNGADAYVIKDGEKSMYYDVKTGLKLADSEEAETAPGQKMTVVTPYSDYRDVKGVKVPFKSTLNIGMEIELTVSEVKINEGVTDADFQ